MILQDLHTHTVYCDGQNAPEDMVRAAIEKGMSRIGFSGHCYTFFDTSYCMSEDGVKEYCAEIAALKEKYKGQIEILLGLECESVPRFYPFLAEVRQRLDYMILGNHGDWTCGESFSELTTPKGLERYVDMAVQGLETGLFLYIAHPDLMLHSYPGMDDAAVQLSRQLCREANRLNIPLEYNLYGKLKKVVPPALGYPCEAFWEIAAEENVRAAVGIDAHRPRNFEIEDMEAGIQKLESMGITVLRDPTKA